MTLSGRPRLAGILRSIVLNALIPVILYRLTKRYLTDSDAVGLLMAGLFPLGESLVLLRRRRGLDPIAVLVLAGILASLIAVAFGGGVKLLLIRESFFTAAVGLACFVSLLMPRPLMFYFGRHFLAGDDPARAAEFDARWQSPRFRFVNRVITVVWGMAFTAEFVARVVLVFTLPPSLVLVISPIVLGTITIATIIWTFAYVRRAGRQREALAR